MQILGKNKLPLRQQDIQLAYQIQYESKLMTTSDVSPSLVSTIGRIFIDLFYYHHLELPSFQTNVYSISRLTLSLQDEALENDFVELSWLRFRLNECTIYLLHVYHHGILSHASNRKIELVDILA